MPSILEMLGDMSKMIPQAKAFIAAGKRLVAAAEVVVNTNPADISVNTENINRSALQQATLAFKAELAKLPELP